MAVRDSSKPLIPVIVGPTAVGKTALVMALAKHWDMTAISADSRQIYRGLNVGTAKPCPEDLALVPHLGIDIVDPGDRYSAGRFAARAAQWIKELGSDRQPVIVGGTGFYIRALADGLFREPPVNSDRRERLRRWAKKKERLGSWAARLDRGYTGGGSQRAARTVEVALLTGRPLSWWQREAKSDGVMRPWYVRLTAPRAVLHARIRERTDGMLRAGLVDEVEAVLQSGIAPDAPGLDAVGYREVVQHLSGELEREKLAHTIAASTRRYAKRQETWFRHQLLGHPVVTLDTTDAPGTLAKRIAELWDSRETE